MDLRAQKLQLKNAIAERLARMNPKDRDAESRSLCRRILAALPNDARHVCAFVPVGDEVDIRPVLEELQRRNIMLYLPCFEGGLVFRKVTNLHDLRPGAFRIPEPPTSAEELQPEALDLALVPGRAFTRAGERMGRGNGGYDRWIRSQRSKSATTRFWGVCFECQVVNTVPMEAHDECVDAVVTARGIAQKP